MRGHPQIRIGKDGAIWVVYHSGVGEEMRIRVLEYGRDRQESE